MAVTAPIVSGSTLLNGTEQTVYEDDGYEPLSIFLDMTLNASGDVVKIRSYGKVVSGGAYVLVDTTTVRDVLEDPGYKSIFMDFPFGIKWTVQQTAGVAYNVPWSVDKVV